MSIDKKFIDKFVNITSQAALESSYLIGKKDKISADKAAVDSMRSNLNNLEIKGEIVIGEGELDEAPMLYIGEKLGTNKGPELDIAVDPLEGTNFAANNLPGALSVIAITEKNNLFKAPETYMEKISAKVNEKNVIDLDFTVKQNIFNLSDYLNKKPENLTACILDRPRHKEIIDELNKLKVNLKLISDGDVSGALLITEEKYNVDIFLGIGGGPEGVLAAAALDTFNCNFQCTDFSPLVGSQTSCVPMRVHVASSPSGSASQGAAQAAARCRSRRRTTGASRPASWTAAATAAAMRSSRSALSR